MTTERLENRSTSAYTISVVLFLVGAGLFVALLTSYSALSFLCILVLFMTAGAKSWSHLSLFGLRSELRSDKKKMFPDETLGITVDVQNHKPLPVWLQIGVPLGASMKYGVDDTSYKKDCGLFSYQSVSFEWQIKALRRGVHCIGPIELEASDPLGFFPQKKREGSCHVVVYPRLIPLNRIPLPRRDFFGKPGSNSPVEDPTYIHGTRDYQCGRAARYIHWKASARRNRLIEKLCEPAEREKVLILVRADNFSDDQTGESLESCLEVAASLAVQLDHMRYSVGLATNGRLEGGGKSVVRISRNPGQLSDILETMARFESVPSGDLIDIIHRGLTLSWTVTAVCFTYTFDAGSMKLYRYLKQRNIPIVMIVCDRGAGTRSIETTVNEDIYCLQDLRKTGGPIE